MGPNEGSVAIDSAEARNGREEEKREGVPSRRGMEEKRKRGQRLQQRLGLEERRESGRERSKRRRKYSRNEGWNRGSI
jgi:hypothetical protein